MLVNITDNKLGIDEMKNEISKSFNCRKLEDMDIIIKKNEEYKIFRLNKEG